MYSLLVKVFRNIVCKARGLFCAGEVNATEIGPAAGPAAVMMGVYDQFLGKDYIPATAAMFNGTGPNLVDVVVRH